MKQQTAIRALVGESMSFPGLGDGRTSVVETEFPLQTIEKAVLACARARVVLEQEGAVTPFLIHADPAAASGSTTSKKNSGL